MTAPKPHFPGELVMITRRTLGRCFFLRPDRWMDEHFLYFQLHYATMSGVQIPGMMCMSNHPHTIVHDHLGQRTDFMRDFHATLARKRNKDLDRTGKLWDGREPNEVVLVDREATEEKLLYAWTNPVKDGLVKRAKHWPGPKILPDDWGKPMRIERPEGMGDHWPEYVEFVPMPPPGYDDMDLEEVRDYFNEKLEAREKEIRLERIKRGQRRVLGARRARRVDPFDSPKSDAPSGERIPRYAGGSSEVVAAAYAFYRAWRARYVAARETWLAGLRATFPAGTIFLARNAPIECAAMTGDEPGIYPPRGPTDGSA